MLDFAPAETFFSPFDDYRQYNGCSFNILRELDDSERDVEAGRMFEIRLEGGEKITAFLEEIDGEYAEAYARL